MWPWGHLAVGYLGYSLGVRLLAGRAPGGAAAVAVTLGTQFPDLVDKPLAWGLGVLPAGYSLAHSVFVAVPLSAVVTWAATDRGRPRAGAAFAVGYLVHLPGDVFYPLLDGADPAYAAVLWPVVPAGAPEPTPGFVETVRHLLARHAAAVARGDPGASLAVEFGLVAAVFGVWLLDGAPPVRSVWNRLCSVWARLRSFARPEETP